MNIGKTISLLRKEKGLSQEEFSKMCGLTQTSLSQIETGATSQPAKRNLEKICNALEVPEYLLYLLSMEEKDVPESKKELYKTLFPAVKEFIINLFDYKADQQEQELSS